MAETGARKWIIAITVISAAVMELIDTSIVNVSLSDMSGNLGATLEDTAWVITAYAIANVIIIPMTSFLAALLGRRVYYVGSIILFTAASVACGAAGNIWVLVFFRFLQGIGGGALLSTSQAILFEAFPLEERGLASGIFGMGIVIGPTIGPTLGGYIVDQLSWPWIFYVNLPVGILATFLALRFVPEPKDARKPTRIDWAGIALLIVGIGSLQTVLERGQTEDWFSKPYIAALSLVAAICLSTFIVWELWVDQPVVNLRVLKSKTLAVAAILTFVLGFGLFVSVFVVPVFAQRLLGFTATQTGLLLLPGAILAAFLLPNIGRLMGKGLPPKPMIVIGFSCFIAFSFLMSRFDLTSGQGNFFWPLIFRGMGIAFLTVPLTVLAVSDLKGPDVPQGAALNNMMRQLGGSFGIAAINTYVAQRSASHRLDLVTHLGIEDSATLSRLDALTRRFASISSDVAHTKDQALHVLDGIITRQTFLLTYLDAFRVVGICFFLCLPLILMVGKTKKPAGPVSVSDH